MPTKFFTIRLSRGRRRLGVLGFCQTDQPVLASGVGLNGSTAHLAAFAQLFASVCSSTVTVLRCDHSCDPSGEDFLCSFLKFSSVYR
jgi:hypothetical protein